MSFSLSDKKGFIRQNLGVILALIAVYFIWGSTYLGIRIAIETCPPFLMAGIRFTLAGCILLTYQRMRGAALPTARQWVGAAIVGCLLLAGGNGGVTWAEQWVASGLAAVWVATMPIWAGLFGGLFGRWPSRMEWLGLLLGFVGVAILNMEGNLRANPAGAIALTIATITWAFGSVWSRRLPMPTGLMSSAAQMICGGFLMILIGLGIGERIVEMPSERSLIAWLYLILFGSLIAFSAYAFLLDHVRPTLATSYAYVNPVVAVGLGVAFGGESITGTGIVAMLIILGAVALVMMGREQPGKNSAGASRPAT